MWSEAGAGYNLEKHRKRERERETDSIKSNKSQLLPVISLIPL